MGYVGLGCVRSGSGGLMLRFGSELVRAEWDVWARSGWGALG